MSNRLYLNVPFSEKEEAKSFGAKWDSTRKNWYYQGEEKNYVNFAKWIFDYEEQEGTLIICDYFYVLEGYQNCWKCKKKTIVVGIGLEKFVELYDLDEEPINYGIQIYGFNNEREVKVAWNDEEEDNPKIILNYLKNNYNVKTGISKIAGSSFANHCQHCGAIQGNYYLFDESGSPFSPIGNHEDIIKSFKNINLKKIILDENIQFNCNLTHGNDDELYLEYCNVENIKL